MSNISVATVEKHEYKCGTTSDTLKTCQSAKTAKTNTCYCTGSSTDGCQDVTACKCAEGTGMTKYANKAQNANNGASESIARITGPTMALAAILLWQFL